MKISGNVLSGVIAQHMEQQGGDADAQELEVQRANYRMSVIMEVRLAAPAHHAGPVVSLLHECSSLVRPTLMAAMRTCRSAL